MDITITVPKTQFVAESPEQIAYKFRLYGALGMYQAGVISIGSACELAEMNIHDFLAFLKRQRIPLMTQTADEFESDWLASQKV